MNEQHADKIRYAEAGRVTGIPVPTLYSMVCRKQIPHMRFGPRLVVFSRADLEKWMNDKRVPSQTPEAIH